MARAELEQIDVGISLGISLGLGLGRGLGGRRALRRRSCQHAVLVKLVLRPLLRRPPLLVARLALAVAAGGTHRRPGGTHRRRRRHGLLHEGVVHGGCGLVLSLLLVGVQESIKGVAHRLSRMVLVAVAARIFCLLARRRLGLSLLELAEVPRGHEGDTRRVRATLRARVGPRGRRVALCWRASSLRQTLARKLLISG